MQQHFTKADWVLFRTKISGWQENHMEKLNREYIALLSENGECPSAKFWKLAKRIREDQRSLGVQMEMRKSDFVPDICALIRDGVIEIADLDDFSEDLRETVQYLCGGMA